MAADTWVNEYYVDSNGAWISGASNSQILTFLDKNLEKIIRKKIDRPTGILYKSDVENITPLTISDSSITNINLNGIENLVNLEYLEVLNSKTSDISILKGLTNLKHLVLIKCGISDISPLKGLTNLQILELKGNPIEAEDVQSLKDALPQCNIR